MLAGAGYYFYKAGGDPKVAQKKAEADAAKLSSEVRQNLPGQGKEVQKNAEAGISELGSKLDQYRKDAASQLDKTSKDVSVSANQAIDKFDQKVNDGAAKAKSGVSSWFGGSK